MSRAAVAIVVTLALAGAVVPALATDATTLQAKDYVFEPADVTIQVGDTVTFTIDPGSVSFHNFRFADGPEYPPAPSPPGPDWNGQSRTFTTPGTYTFVCGAHSTMTGVVKVEAPAATPTPAPTSTPSSDPGTLEVRTLRMAAGPFCTKRGPRCARPGVRVRIDLSQPATVSGTLRRRGRSFGGVRFGTVPAGPRTLTFRRNAAGRRLTAGRYTLRLQVAGEAQDALRFKVR
jgi:plastocyanin